MQKELSVVIPVYNSEKNLDELYERLTKVLSQITDSYEIILVDDYSRDNSYKKMKELREKDALVKIIQLSKNFGQHNAIMCGLQYAGGKYNIIMDDDLQNPPEEIPKLYYTSKETNSDAVIGRYIKKEHSLLRNLGSYFISLSYKKIFKNKKLLRMSNFKILKRELAEKVISNKNPNPVLGALMFMCSSNIINIDIEHHKRKYGKSNYNLANGFKLAFDLLINYSTIPLKFVSMLGSLCCTISLLWGLTIFIRKLQGFITIPGWSTIIIVILFFSGLNMLVFGIIGEYLARFSRELSHYPQYVIHEIDIGDGLE